MVIFRAWTHTDSTTAAREFFAIPPPRRAAVRKLMAGVCSADPAVRKRATDLARLVSEREPGILSDWADVLIDVVAELARESESPAAEWQACGYVAVAASLNAVMREQRIQLAVLLRSMLSHTRIALRASALEAFCRVAAQEPGLREEALDAIEEARVSGTPAMRARARGMMGPLGLGTAARGRRSKSTRI